MRTLSEMFGIETYTETLAAQPKRKSAGVPLGKKTTPELARIKPSELERTYIEDPLVFNCVNKVVQIIMSAGHRLQGKPESVAYFEKFFSKIGSHGGLIDWKTLLETIFKHQCVYGAAFNEIIYDQEMTEILDLDFIDPKQMDYAKSGSLKIVSDIYGNPAGYVQTVPYSEYLGGKSDPYPKDVSLGPNQIFFLPDRIVQYKLHTIGDGFYGIGLVEPIYKVSNWKLGMLQALTNIYQQVGFPTRVAKVGNQFQPYTEELGSKTAEQLSQATYRSSLVFPDYVDVQILEPKNVAKLREPLQQFIDEEVTGTGVPRAFATGAGEETNRATLGRQEYIFKLALRDIINRTTQTIEKQIFSKIVELEGLPDVPKIIWGEINLEELDSKADRLVKYAAAGLVRPDVDLENIIRKMEDLPQKGAENGGKNIGQRTD